MVKSKKSATKTASKATVSDNKAEARPIGEGKDPLAEGNTLVNPSNTEAETHYDVKEKSEDVAAQDAQNTINGQDANQRAEAHNAQAPQPSGVSNSDQAEQDAVAEGRTEEAANPPVNDTPENVDVPDVSEEDQAQATEERQDAVETALETTDKP